MSVVELKPPIPAELRRNLAQLPSFEPPVLLWQRIAQNLPGRSQRLRWRVAAAVLLGTAASLGWWSAAHAPLLALEAKPALDVSGMRDLEVALAQVRRSPQDHPQIVLLESELRELDQRLQMVYLQDGERTEIGRLAQTRMELLRALLVAYRQPEALFRI